MGSLSDDGSSSNAKIAELQRALRPSETRRERVLFVDDEPHIVRLAEELLGALGFEVVGQSSALAALEAFRLDPSAFDVVVTDHKMHELEGIELAARLSRIRPGVPVVLLSGYAESIPAHVLRSSGIVATYPKPYDFDALAERIREHLGARDATRMNG